MSNFTVARVGQVNAAGDAKALFLKLWAGEVLTTFDTENVASGLHMTRSISSGKSAQFPVAGQVTASFHVPGTEIAGQAVNHNEKVINIDDLLIAPVVIPSIDEAMNHYDYRSIYTRECGRALAKAYDKRVLQVMTLAARASATLTGGNGGSEIRVASMDTSASVLLNAIADAAQKLDEKNIPADDRFVILRPAQYWLLVKDKAVMNRDFAGAGSIAKGDLPEYAGIKIVKSNNLPSTLVAAVAGENNTYNADFTKTVAIVAHKSVAGTVNLLDLATEMEYSVRHQATLIVSKYAKGSGILRPEAAVELGLPLV